MSLSTNDLERYMQDVFNASTGGYRMYYGTGGSNRDIAESMGFQTISSSTSPPPPDFFAPTMMYGTRNPTEVNTEAFKETKSRRYRVVGKNHSQNMKEYEPLYRNYFSDEWYELLKEEINTKVFQDIGAVINFRRDVEKIYPLENIDIFHIFRQIKPEDVKVVFIGQDVYPDGSYDGIAFSNSPVSLSGKKNTKISPSLRNIFKEVRRTIYSNDPNVYFDPNLHRWVEQGVFLINSSLTVKENSPGSHIELWKPFLQSVVKRIAHELPNVIFVFVGNIAKDNLSIGIAEEKCLYVGHPSPLNMAKPFVGSDIFLKINEKLNSKIIW